MPNPGRSRQPKLFVCYTVPEQLSADFEMPDDLCDVVLIGIECYGALADEQENIAWNDKWLFDIPSKYHKTKFGFVTCVMDYDEVFPDIANQKFFQLLGKVPLHYYGIGILKELWRSPTLGSVDVNAPFVYVKKIRDMFWPTAKIVYKVELDSKKNVDYFIDMCRNTLMPDLIVVTAHDYFPGPEVKKQVLLPPNIFYRPVDFWYQANYGNTMPDAMAVALTLINYGVNRPISLVVTMAGTKAQMQYPDIRNPKAGRYAIYQPAVNVYGSWFDHFTNPKAMCSGKGYEAYRANLQYQENALTWLAFNKSQNVETSMAFDTAETLRYKICQVFVNHTYDPLTQLIDFGISELAWDEEPCDLPNWKSPPYERVRMVRAVSKFLTDEYWDSSDLYFCLKVKP
ncbi:uncharacterized protein LOC142590167 [Dermacentor variabilis]|uniref:uncharacterized protein LOC142590167 n=1 Tax=Dermacentor variabilis TaxID=34621 RepID=UPI003F5C816C